ncbi:MAG: hypothetical protein AB4426_26300 [Xenococcaceae cyanobacterium]
MRQGWLEVGELAINLDSFCWNLADKFGSPFASRNRKASPCERDNCAIASCNIRHSKVRSLLGQ